MVYYNGPFTCLCLPGPPSPAYPTTTTRKPPPCLLIETLAHNVQHNRGSSTFTKQMKACQGGGNSFHKLFILILKKNTSHVYSNGRAEVLRITHVMVQGQRAKSKSETCSRFVQSPLTFQHVLNVNKQLSGSMG